MASYTRRVTAEQINELVNRDSLGDLLSVGMTEIYVDPAGNGLAEVPVALSPGVYEWSGYYYPVGAAETVENRVYISVHTTVISDPDAGSGFEANDAVSLGGEVVRIIGANAPAYDKASAAVSVAGQLVTSRTTRIKRLGAE